MELESQETLISLLLITVLAAAVPLVAARLQRFRIPLVVGEIVVGIIIGKSGFNLITENPILQFLAWFGFIFLMFLSGLELDFGLLRASGDKDAPFWKQPVPQAIGVFALTLTLGMVAGVVFRQAGVVNDAVLMGLILSTTSLGVVVPVLKEHRLSTSRYGQVLLISALLADFVTLLLLSIDVAVLSKGLTLDLLLILVLLAVVGLAVRGSRVLANLPGVRQVVEEMSHATAQIQVRGSFALMVALAAFASVLGVEVILGAFLAGAVVSLLAERHDSILREKLDAIGFGFFIPIFFIMVGVNFDIQSLLASRENLLLVPLLLVTAFAIKIIASLLFRIEYDWRHTLAAGSLLSARLSLIIAASAIALELAMIDDAMNSAIILVAIVTVSISPIMFDQLLPMAKEVVERKGIVIVGSQELAPLLAKRLAVAEPVTIISRRNPRPEPTDVEGVFRVRGNASNPDVLAKAGAATASALVSLSRDPSFNVEVARIASEQFCIERIVMLADNGLNSDDLETSGVHVIRPQLATLLSIEGAVRFPASYDLLSHQDADMDVGEARLTNKVLHKRTLRELHLPGEVLVIGVQRYGERIIAHGETVLELGDVVLMIGSPHCLRDAKLQLQE